ncbi:MAG: hypothetical protein A2848_01070 [Candidatus Magasanikbacteria bacterium RIFCSPHIGHO2_01_FULL_50_8]|uniref:Uncharacterized protein n=2 Tax=Candidatus Magasanikiibacteriota TaxID=1752731 RepID=A0A1F6LSD4_9BACT|nr:MAG: hypothetical protein A2848_01070 [Candidatus Magasanikbacteria bacterium RIFCSPHIGHO2_01_FULL_50_8]OGH67561.1 MAG: hypothetical protein A3C15_03300 [Candidatus Magasanikbacteria bacterium RIFCSPHIGHO2_02_FULL_50_9b]
MKRQKIQVTILALVLTCGFFGAAATVDAQQTGTGAVALINPLQNSVNSEAPVQSLSAIFINALFGVAGSVALAMFVWGGMLWLTSAGNEKQVDQGKQIIKWTTLGIILMFAAYTLVSFLFSNLGNAPVATTAPGAGGAAGGGTAAGGAAQTTSFCCVDYNNNTVATVTSKGACSGAKKEFVADSCDKIKFCPASPVHGYEACTPYPVASQCLAGGSGYKSLNDCLTVEKGKPSAGGVKP